MGLKDDPASFWDVQPIYLFLSIYPIFSNYVSFREGTFAQKKQPFMWVSVQSSRGSYGHEDCGRFVGYFLMGRFSELDDLADCGFEVFETDC